MTTTQKQCDLSKYILKNLEDYNRISAYFNNKLPQTLSISELISNIILQVKTVFNIIDVLDISSNICYINIYDDYVKKIQKYSYIKQNRVYALHMLSQSKSNLFGWSDQEDGDVLDKYMSQQNIEKYRYHIIDLHDLHSIPNPLLSNVQLCKEHIEVITQCTNLCKDTYICESYIDYKLKLDAVTCFIIREYIESSSTGNPIINIMLLCEFNEETKILPDKLVKFENYITAINYIITNIC